MGAASQFMRRIRAMFASNGSVLSKQRIICSIFIRRLAVGMAAESVDAALRVCLHAIVAGLFVPSCLSVVRVFDVLSLSVRFLKYVLCACVACLCLAVLSVSMCCLSLYLHVMSVSVSCIYVLSVCMFCLFLCLVCVDVLSVV